MLAALSYVSKALGAGGAVFMTILVGFGFPNTPVTLSHWGYALLAATLSALGVYKIPNGPPVVKGTTP